MKVSWSKVASASGAVRAMASDIALRIKSRLLKRRHSSNAPSFISHGSAASSVGSESLPRSKTPSHHAEQPSPLSSDGRENGPVLVVGDGAQSLTGAKGDPPQQQSQHQPSDRQPPAAASPHSQTHPHPQPQLALAPAQPHTSPRSPTSSSRLHSIDEGISSNSPTAAAAAHDHLLSAHDSSESALTRDRRPGPLELNLISNHHLHPDAAAAFAQQPSSANTPAGATSPSFHPPAPLRRQSIISHRQTSLIKTLLQAPSTNDGEDPTIDLDPDMVTTRKIWVKRPHASPTLVTINEDDLVDDVRDMILRKYANSLGRTFDSPDLTLRICPRDPSQKERILGPEEHMGRTFDTYFPGGQNVDEALIIDIPRRTPKPSPRPTGLYVTEDGRPPEAGDGYFPPVIAGVPSPHHQVAVPAPTNGTVPHSISVIGTGQIPPIPSPGGTRRAYQRAERPRAVRTHASSPNAVANGNQASNAASDPATHGMQHYLHRPSHSRAHSSSSDHKGLSQSGAPPMPTSPVTQSAQGRVATPPPRVSSPRQSASRIKKTKKPSEYPSLQGVQSILSGGVPPISVLIVEDNPINLKLLEAFVKRLKVRWQTAMNGRDAVKKWRTGGFHLVLMDIQLPVMNGLDATREIRRLERVNSIGVFSSSPSSLPDEEGEDGELNDQDRLENLSLFKSPVIIVALTASSLQSDRHDALAAGCNDFLTKPVNFVWLERKVMEWGCMQALIDFDGWRKWKDFTQDEENSAAKKTLSSKPVWKKKSSLS
ncbi:Two-component response regulator SSK1p [Amphichorda felina]